MKILLMTGSYPPDICGVSDYTGRLEESLTKAGAIVTVYTGKHWGPCNAPGIVRELRAISADVLHMQYPATGYGWKLGPQLLSLLQPFVMTIHECSQTHILRKLSLYPFSLRAPKIIFTNEFERQYAQEFAPWIKGRSALIPIGNNVSLATSQVSRLTKVVTYFGLIRPHKGLEQVLHMARLFKRRGKGFSVRVVGTVLPGCEDYHARLLDEARELPVQWILGLDGEQLSRTLSETEVAYLPFEDGASERRSSLIAMLSNRAAVITTRGSHTPYAMEEAVLLTATPNEAVTLAEEMYSNPDLRGALQARAGAYAVKFAWNNIAAEHIAIYQELISGKPQQHPGQKNL